MRFIYSSRDRLEQVEGGRGLSMRLTVSRPGKGGDGEVSRENVTGHRRVKGRAWPGLETVSSQGL